MNYNRKQFSDALRKAGLKKGDTVFTHSNIGYFGVPEEGSSPDIIFNTILGAFFDVIGPKGTLAAPVFTLSFCKQQAFDPDNSVSFCGAFSERLRKHPGALRSLDPLFSVAALGARAKQLTENVSQECFGRDSFWDRFLKAGGVFCNMNLDAGSTFAHYVEKCLNVPYRYDKLFPGRIVKNGREEKSAAVFFCQDMSNPDTVAAFEKFDALARKKGKVRSAPIGRGAVTAIKAKDTYDLIAVALKKDPWLLTEAGKTGKKPSLLNDDPNSPSLIKLSPSSGMVEIIDKIWKLSRELVSDGYDAALYGIAKAVDMKIHRYPTGTKCWTWIIPEKWTCKEAYLETLGGKRLFDHSENPLHCTSYSLPFEGIVDREELFKHLYTHDQIPEAVPYIFKPYERIWGLACSKKLKETLKDEKYKAVVRTSYSYGELKVGEVIVKGRSKDTFVLCAHLCHTHMTNDDLAGVAVGVEVMRRLKKRPGLHYTYRLLLVPETIGSVAWLSANENIIPSIKGGIFLEMLGRNAPHALQLSFKGGTRVDKCAQAALRAENPANWTGAFRTVIQNDENQFNAPSVRIPMLSLSRVDRPESKTWPYPEYHSDLDNMSNVIPSKLEESCALVLNMVEELERGFVDSEENLYVVNNYTGELFCSRYGVHIDFYANPNGNRRLFEVIYLIDGTQTVADIARLCKLSITELMDVLNNLEGKGLVRFSKTPVTKVFSKRRIS